MSTPTASACGRGPHRTNGDCESFMYVVTYLQLTISQIHIREASVLDFELLHSRPRCLREVILYATTETMGIYGVICMHTAFFFGDKICSVAMTTRSEREMKRQDTGHGIVLSQPCVHRHPPNLYGHAVVHRHGCYTTTSAIADMRAAG